jgi:ribonucleoside-diphosphate reductase alpha chain
MDKDDSYKDLQGSREATRAWDIMDEYLTASRYAVRDPKTGEPLERNYETVLAGRIIPKLAGAESPIKDPDLIEDIAVSLLSRHLIPATPLLMSFGNPHTRRPGYFSCYPLGFVGDSLSEIEDMRRKMRVIYMAGGGAGIDISRLRAKGSPVDMGQGIASGPVGFLPDFDAVTGTTNQGGRRRGALLVQMDWNHPDIKDFVEAKNFNAKINKFIQSLPPGERPLQSPHLSNMNISVNVFGEFWDHPELVELIARNMWTTGDPGLLFVDNMLKYSPLRAEDEPRFSNPCGEYLASEGTACNLVTVNAARLARITYEKLIKEGLSPDNPGDPSKDSLWTRAFQRQFWGILGRTAGLASYLGSLILDFGEGYPLPEIREKTQAKRPVGVGLSGFHTALLLAYWGRAGYGSAKAVSFARSTQASLTLGTLTMSASLARKTGKVYENAPYWTTHLGELRETLGDAGMEDVTFPILDDLHNLVTEKGGFYNCLTTSQAPTGSVSNFLRNIDTGIEPFFALSVDRRVRDPKEGWITFTLKPAELSDIFKKDKGFLERAEAQTALKLPPLDQLNMLAAFQRHNHTGVSKTVNLPSTVTVDDVKKLILTSRDMRLKGFTIYRDSSLEGVLSVSKKEEKKEEMEKKERGEKREERGDGLGGSQDQSQPGDDGAHPLPGPQGPGERMEAPEKLASENGVRVLEDPNLDDVGDDRPGRIYKARSGSLSAHITLSHDASNNIREVFVSAGDVGADINAIFTAFGMILSVSLRKAPFLFDSLVKVLTKVKMDQRVVIRTHMSEAPIVGNSLPQAIGLLMRQRKDYLDKGCQVPVPHDFGNYDLCPECQKLSLRREGSCRKCDNCGYSTC